MSSTATLQTCEFDVLLFREPDGVRVIRQGVPRGFLQPCAECLVFDGQRQGRVPLDADSGAVRIQPTFTTGPDRLAGAICGFQMSLAAGGEQVVRNFPLMSFKPFADDLLAQLIAAKQLTGEERLRYRVCARQVERQPATGVTAKVRRSPLPLLSARLDDLAARSAGIGPAVPSDYPVFVDREVVRQSVQASWKESGVEGGAWLIGNLYQQTDPPEIFARIHTVLEATGVCPDRDRLDLSTTTYVHLQTTLAQRRQRLGKVGELLLGFVHSHPFLPCELDGKGDCRHCDRRRDCDTTSAFLSPRDAKFHKALFGAAPFAVQIVLGLTPRAELDLRMFCLDGCHFRERGSSVLDDDRPVAASVHKRG